MKGAVLTLLRALIVSALPYSAGAGSPAAQLPDLGIVPLEHMNIQNTPDSKKLLRFSTSIANVGAGPIEIVASRPGLARPSPSPSGSGAPTEAATA